MIRLGLTGGIGSGKTTVAKIFESFGVPVYYADDEAKRLMNESEIQTAIIAEFGDETYINGRLNRAHLAGLVFGNEVRLQALNAIVHPVVGKDYETWCAGQKSDIILKEAAILIESGAVKTVDKVVVVSAAEQTRIKRVMLRDGVSEEQVKSRMKHQLTEEERLSYADFVVYNDGEQLLNPQVQEILNDLRNLV